MGVNPGPIICSTTAAITHNQRINKENEKQINLTNNVIKATETYDPVSSTKEILEELKKILEQKKSKNEMYISIYDVINLVRKKYENEKRLDYYLHQNIKHQTGIDSLFLDTEFDFKNMELIISYHCNKMFLKKENGDLIITRSQYHKAKDILGKCGNEISKRYDKFIESIGFYQDYINDIKSINSGFIINSDKYRINLNFNNSFKLYANLYDKKYEYDCNSNNVTSVCRNKEEELLKNIFVKIEDCPEWAHELLYKFRKEQLEEQEKIEYKEMKKQKRLELIRKLNPFKTK